MWECLWCDAEIKHLPDTLSGEWSWESEDLLGWCDIAPDHKHHPNLVVKYQGEL